ncbi:MAG TPA: DUF507 family protein [Pseudobdellovibrionaceae bacterium]|nr:DUF507 family protein [Pseudobdellovibrionaceae bacterium]
MILSEERQTHFAHVITDGVWKDDIVDFTDEDLALKLAKTAIRDFVKEDSEVDVRVRAKVGSLKRGVIEGTPEWDILYQKYYQEEKNKRGQS